MAYHWFVYPEAGTYRGNVAFAAEGPAVDFSMPRDAQGTTIHLIVAVQDRGEPPLTRDRRAVLRGTSRLPP